MRESEREKERRGGVGWGGVGWGGVGWGGDDYSTTETEQITSDFDKHEARN